eukprot:4436498-Prymnesium_polylepis.1
MGLRSRSTKTDHAPEAHRGSAMCDLDTRCMAPPTHPMAMPRAANRSVPRYLATRMEVEDRGTAMRLGVWDCVPGAG